MDLKGLFGTNIYVTTPQDKDPFFHPRRYSRPKEEIIKIVLEVLAGLRDWKVEEYRENQGRIRANHSALFPPSAQDINIYVVEGMDGSTKLEMNSQSRGGKADFGRNKKNIKEFLVRVDRNIPPIS